MPPESVNVGLPGVPDVHAVLEPVRVMVLPVVYAVIEEGLADTVPAD